MGTRSYRIFIVDENDKPIGYKTYGDLMYEDIYRVTALWLTDKNSGDILITQRKWTEYNDPGKWIAAVAGTVEEGETYDENITKETSEEIGLRDIKFRKGPKVFIDDSAHRFFCQWYFAEIDKDKTKIVIQEDEVEAFRWISKHDLIEEFKNHPEKHVPSAGDTFRALGIL